MKNKCSQTPKLNKSTKYYLIYGIISVVVIIGLLLIYAVLIKADILAWFTSRYAMIAYLAIFVYVIIALILIVKDKIRRM